MYRFALRPRWIVRHAVVLVMVVLFAVAGLWQIHRLHERRARNALVGARERAPEAPIGTALADERTATYRRVTADGTYDTSREVVLLGRANGDRDGNHVLTPLVGARGPAVLVDRGWVPRSLDAPPLRSAAPPAGTVVVRGELLSSERSPFHGGKGLTKVVSLVDLNRLGRQLPYPIATLYLLLSAQTPAQSGQLPVPVAPPSLDEGPHKSYAIQWFSFIVIALVGYGAFLRREARRTSVHAAASVPKE